MATRPLTPRVSPAPSKRSTSTLRQTRKARRVVRPFIPDIPASLPSVRIAGGAIRLSPDVPTRFGNPVGQHHVTIGKWARDRLVSAGPITENGFKHLVEQTFADAVGEILAPVELCDLHTMVLLNSENDKQAALVLANKSQGQIDLGWIETDEDAPLEWRCAAYSALVTNLQPIIPSISFDDMFEHLSMLYWDGETQDGPAREVLENFYGHDEEELEGMAMPSQVIAKIPAWMKDYAGDTPARPLHPQLAKILSDLKKASARLKRAQKKADPFEFSDMEDLCSFAPWYEESYSLPPTTVVPFEIFAAEIDDVARGGMEQGFLDAIGIYHLDPAAPELVGRWLETLRAGVAVIEIIQRLTAWIPNQHLPRD